MKNLLLAMLIVLLLTVPAAAQEGITELRGEFVRGRANVNDTIDGENASMLIFDLNTTMVSDFSVGLTAGQGEIQNTDHDALSLLEIYGKYGLAPEAAVIAGYKNFKVGPIQFRGLKFGGDFTLDFDPQLDILLKVNYLPFLEGTKDGGTYNADALEVDAGLSYIVFDRLEILGGYRTKRYTLEQANSDIDANFSGIYIGFSHRF